MTSSANSRAASVEARWLAACRAHPVLSTLPQPQAPQLVEVALANAMGGPSSSPDSVLAGLASGLAAVDWHASGEVLQQQIGLLSEEIAAEPTADPRRTSHAHTVMSAAAAAVAISAWRSKAETDELTSLRNLTGWSIDRRELESNGTAIAVAMIDLDGLKAINDSEGHDAGDELIRSFAHRLQVAVNGAGGSTYRHGGDEFSAALPVESGDLSAILLELQQDASIANFSFGVRLWPESDSDLATVMRYADQDMYAMKETRKKVDGQSATDDDANG